MATKKSKKKITKVEMKSCPCPDHKGKKLPATFGYWHKGGNPDGFQGYCKQWRNKSQNAANKAARKAAKRAGKKKGRHSQIRHIHHPPVQLTVIVKKAKKKAINLPAKVCTQCDDLRLQSDFQSNGKGGFRQPCKNCIAKKRAEQKKKVDISINSA